MNSETLLAAMRDPAQDPVPVLLNAFQNPNADLRLEALYFLREMQTTRGFDALVLLLHQDPDDLIRCEAAEALGEQEGNQNAITNALLVSVTDPSEGVRLCVAEALGLKGQGDQRATDALCRLIADPDGSVRIFALEALGDLGDRSALPALRCRREVWEPSVRVWLYYALVKLGDKPFGPGNPLRILRRRGKRARLQAGRVLARLATQQTAPRIRRILKEAQARETSVGMREAMGRWLSIVESLEPDARLQAVAQLDLVGDFAPVLP